MDWVEVIVEVFVVLNILKRMHWDISIEVDELGNSVI